METGAACESERERIGFTPPLYLQRDEKIIQILRESSGVERVLDLGCAECRLIKKLKEIEDVQFICGIDIEKNLLVESAHLLQPLLWNAAFPRANPLKIVLLSGSMLEINELMLNCDVVILSEVIEHLVSEDLSQLPGVVFSMLRPRICIITTPNYEYNVVFGNAVKFRHPDHKFEWTRKEFTQWCESITSNYTYSVEYDGVGNPPASHPGVGFCSQIAVFRLTVSPLDMMSIDLEMTDSHVLVAEIDYQHEHPLVSLEKKKLSVVYSVLEGEANSLTSNEDQPDRPDGESLWLEGGKVYASLDVLMESRLMQNYFENSDELRDFLIRANFKLHADRFVVYDTRAHSESEDEDEGT